MLNYTTSFTPKPNKPHCRRDTTHLPSAQRRRVHRPGVQYLRHSQGFGRRMPGRPNRAPRRRDSRRPYAMIAVGCALLLFLASVVWYINRSVTVELNGSEVSVRIHATVEQLIADQELDYRAGDLLAVDDSVLEKRGGERYSVKLDGKSVSEGDLASTELLGGEKLEIGAGGDIYEEHEVQATEIAPTLTVKGSGPIKYVETWGVPGRSEIWVGKVSGKTQDRGVVTEVQDCVVRASNVNPEDGKVVALTFDEAPSAYTKRIVDILRKAGAGATFFVQGDHVAGHEDAVAAIAEAGFELGANGYADTDMSELAGSSLRDQIEKGFSTVKEVSGSATALLRPPFGLFSDTDWAEAMDLVSAVVTWNIDSGDYQLQGADTVVENVMGSVGNGDVILLTDSDAVGEQALSALPELLSRLREEGYRVVSVGELVASDPDLAEEVGLSKVKMPDGAVLPELASDGDDAGE